MSSLGPVDAALVCVPTEHVFGVAEQLLQQRIPVVECARLQGRALDMYQEALKRSAERHRTRAIMGAGWDPSALTCFKRLFDVLIPKGHTEVTNHPGISLHHTASVAGIDGVKEALCMELKTDEGKLQRYVYVEIDSKAKADEIVERIRSDPLFVGEETLVFPAASLSDLEDKHGERRSGARESLHQTLLLEVRFDMGVSLILMP